MSLTHLTSLPVPKPMDLVLTVVSAKHLKNVNWRHGDLIPYAVAYLDPDRRVSTKSDDVFSTKPVWNERLLLTIPNTDDPSSLLLTIDIFHNRKPSFPETLETLVGTARCRLSDVIDLTAPSPSTEPSPIKTLDVRRPSGRPQGKIRIRIAVSKLPPSPLARPSFYFPQDYPRYNPLPRTAVIAPPQPHPSPDASPYAYLPYSDPYRGYNPSAPVYASGMGGTGGYDYVPPRSYYSDPSAPMVYMPATVICQDKLKPMPMGRGVGTGLAAGAMAGALGGLTLEEGIKYGEEKVADRVEGDHVPRVDYRDYHRGDY